MCSFQFIVRLQVNAHGISHMLETVTLQQLGKTALQHGDLLRATVHQRRNEHHQIGTRAVVFGQETFTSTMAVRPAARRIEMQ